MKNISVIITSYNQKKYLKEAIESVIDQTLRPFEIIVCDDSSSDRSQELISNYEQKYPDLIKGCYQNINVGISKNRNSGLKMVRGEYVTWLDGDDRFKPRKLEIEMEYLNRNKDAKWIYSQVEMINDNGDNVIKMLGKAPRNQLVKYDALKNIGYFRTDMDLYEDFELCLRLARHYKAAYCSEHLVEYRIHDGGIHNVEWRKHQMNLRILQSSFNNMISDLPFKRYLKLKRLIFL